MENKDLLNEVARIRKNVVFFFWWTIASGLVGVSFGFFATALAAAV